MAAHRIVIILLSSVLTALLLGIYLPKAHAQKQVCTEYSGGVTICTGPMGQQSQQIKYQGGSGGYYSDSQGNSGSTTTTSNGRTTLDNTHKDVTPPQRQK